jgi:hypothetical protein
MIHRDEKIRNPIDFFLLIGEDRLFPFQHAPGFSKGPYPGADDENKKAAFLNRGEIRDCFDIEFLLRRGVALRFIDQGPFIHGL